MWKIKAAANLGAGKGKKQEIILGILNMRCLMNLQMEMSCRKLYLFSGQKFRSYKHLGAICSIRMSDITGKGY